MERNLFLAKFAEQFEDTDPNEIKFETIFRDLDEWGSLVGLMVLGMVKEDFGKDMTALELKSCITVEDVYQMINKK